jgi:hypothetical protein
VDGVSPRRTARDRRRRRWWWHEQAGGGVEDGWRKAAWGRATAAHGRALAASGRVAAILTGGRRVERERWEGHVSLGRAGAGVGKF